MRVHETTIDADSPAGKALLNALMGATGGKDSGSIGIDLESILGSPNKRGAKISEIFGDNKPEGLGEFAAFLKSVIESHDHRSHHKSDPATEIAALRELVASYTSTNPFGPGDLVQTRKGSDKKVFIVLETFPGKFPANEAEYDEIDSVLPPTCLIAHSLGGKNICTHYVQHSALKAYEMDAAKSDDASSADKPTNATTA